MYKMYLGINDSEEGFILPVLPDKIEFNEDGDNKTYNIINLGEINTINKPKLTKINFKSFFPKFKGPYVSSEQLFEPSFYISKIREWRKNKQKIRFIFVGSPLEINDLFSIENFKIYEQGGEVGDVYYSIEFKRYKIYAARKTVIVTKQNAKSMTVKTNNKPPRPVNKAKPKTHIVAKEETLWSIAKKILNDGSRHIDIARINNIKNPNIIYPGQILKMPI